MKINIQETIKLINSEFIRINGCYRQFAQQNKTNYYLMKVVYAMHLFPSITQKQISENYKIPKQTVGSIINTLEEQKYVILEINENDKRIKEVAFTAKGKKYAETILAPMIELERKATNKIGEKVLVQLQEALTIYADALEEVVDI